LFVVVDCHGECLNAWSGEVVGGHQLVEDDDIASLRGDAQLRGRSVIGAAGEPDNGDRVFLDGRACSSSTWPAAVRVRSR
jgi:hypothetical protein